MRCALLKVVLGASRIVFEIRNEACHAQLPDAGAHEADRLVVEAAIELKHRQSATLILPKDRKEPPAARPDRTLIRAICVTREWRRMLEAGEIATTKDLARREGLCPRHTARILPLAYLAPDLVETTLDGRQPRSMTLQALTAKPLPRAWEDQRQLFASFA